MIGYSYFFKGCSICDPELEKRLRKKCAADKLNQLKRLEISDYSKDFNDVSDKVRRGQTRPGETDREVVNTDIDSFASGDAYNSEDELVMTLDSKLFEDTDAPASVVVNHVPPPLTSNVVEDANRILIGLLAEVKQRATPIIAHATALP